MSNLLLRSRLTLVQLTNMWSIYFSFYPHFYKFQIISLTALILKFYHHKKFITPYGLYLEIFLQKKLCENINFKKYSVKYIV